MNNNSRRQDYNKRLRQMQIRQQKKAHRRRFAAWTVILYVFLILLFLFVFSISLKSCKKEEPKRDIVTETEEKTQKIPKKNLYIDDTFYIPLSAISELTDIQVTGDNTKQSFIFEESDEFAKFEIGTLNAEVNSNKIELSAVSQMIDGELYLPFDFFTEHVKGFTIKTDEKNDTYVITKNEGELPRFILKSPSPTEPVNETDVTDISESPMDFVLDLSSYEKYMNPSDRDKYLFIVNEEKPLAADYEPDDLVGSIYTRPDRDTRVLSAYACYALEAFLKEGEANGITGVTVTSAYRSYEYQEQLFNQEVAAMGSAEKAAKNVNPPGISEHQTGLAVDMHNMSAASQAFANTKEAKWLAENAHKFGFILRYPADKTDITGISYEPWHFRYVGRYHATKMHELEMCLEEYMEYIELG